MAENLFDNVSGNNLRWWTQGGLLTLSLNPYTYATLPTSSTGTIAYITDSTTVIWGAIIAGGSTNKVLAWFNGTNWTVIGI